MTRSLKIRTPQPVENRPGLDEIRTRVGTHSQFYASMLRRLADAHRPGLSDLRTRTEGDYTLGLFDAWAGVCHTLAFYAERDANEAYLRTATERESVRAHADLIGYQLAPAKAAGVHLAFEAEPGDAPDETLEYAPGLRVRSVPRDGETPQIFETVEPLTARAEWNALTPRLAYPQVLDADSETLSLTADVARVNAGDPILLMRGNMPVAFGEGEGFLRRVSDRSAGLDGRRIVALKADPTNPPPYVYIASLLVFPAWDANQALNSANLGAAVSGGSWTASALSTTTALNNIGLFTLNLAISSLVFVPPDPILPHAMRVQAGFFGNIAITRRTSPVESDTTAGLSGTGAVIFAGPSLSAGSYTTQQPSDILSTAGDIDEEGTPSSGRGFIYLEREFTEITPGQTILIRDATHEAWVSVHAAETQSVEGYSMSAKVTRLEVALSGTGPDGASVSLETFQTRTATVFAMPEALTLSDLPITAPVGAADGALTTFQVELGTSELLLLPGKTVIVTGELEELAGVVASEVLEIAENTLDKGHSILTFTTPFANRYVRASVTICANVAFATHGETVQETLGDGDATRPFQAFTLSSKPLTYVSARTASGMLPALEVRVDRVLWSLVDDFRDAGPEDPVYIVRHAEDGTAQIIFGGGQRLPTGQDNVEAVYRKGAGLAGHLEAHQLTLLAAKPAGLKGVTNPLPPGGGADAEVLEDARKNAPLKVLTLGRVVSLRDYEDFARGFASVAKARADWTFDGFDRPIYVTVAGQDGVELAENGDDMQNLKAALAEAGEADQRVYVQNYAPVEFGLEARLYVDAAFVPDEVEAAARAQALDVFSFDSRGLGQPVTRAEAMAALQAVPGVLGVDVDFLYRLGLGKTNEPHLVAAVAQPDLSGGLPIPAELLTLGEAALKLEIEQ
ncbi:putative baseplate assembly protein [Roseivivax lentus]|uniref:Putative baseplate assembly protein n=1 Tax=Roseivivax lentus TaxID=633194 RepID=A0A1N7NU26_9RHOB|nr:putative baseplate assembly protein [Roseivivax lentus]SIT01817.1 putative baseplate assembly protein [Roseivivax lentus]